MVYTLNKMLQKRDADMHIIHTYTYTYIYIYIYIILYYIINELHFSFFQIFKDLIK